MFFKTLGKEKIMSHRALEDGMWYDFHPPAEVQGKHFPRVLCLYQVPGHSNEYCCRGIPAFSQIEESFILRFTKTGRDMEITPSENQSK